ncbi:hypothetical protein MMC21_005085 [Puttea exsequens]|nr:hypothetical protein [Puttea exsequens]
MCVIEVYEIVFPNGYRQRRERLVNCCAQSTPHRLCRDVQYVNNYRERPASAADLQAASERRTGTSTPRHSQRSTSRSHAGSSEKSRGVLGDLAAVYKKWKRSSWGKSGKANGTKLSLVRRKSPARGPRPPIIDYPLPDQPPPRAPSPPRRTARPMPPRVIHIGPAHTGELEHDRRGRSGREAGSRPRRPGHSAVIHHSSESSDNSDEEERDTPSPPTPFRQHEPRMPSPHSKRELERQRRTRDQQHHEYAQRTAEEANAARKRAERVAEYERLERERQRQDRIEFEARKRIESAERARRRREREEYEREQAKRRQELADFETLRVNAARVAREARERRIREEEAERQARLRNANIPRQPRHTTAVYHPEGMGDRGERVINEAIRMRDAISRENLRQFERQAPLNAGRGTTGNARGGLRRHNTTDGSHRRRHDGRDGR